MRTIGAGAAFLAGCALGLAVPSARSPAPLLVGLVVLILGWLLARPIAIAREGGLLLLVATVGVLRVILWPGAETPLPADLVNARATLTGEVVTIPQTTARMARFTLRTAGVERDGQPDSQPGIGQVQAIAYMSPTVQHIAVGDVLQIDGRLQPLSDTAPGADALRRAGVVASIQFPTVRYLDHVAPGVDTLSVRVRSYVSGGFQRVLPPTEATFAAAVLLGGSTGLPDDVRSDLQASGLSHFTAIDGYKVSVIVAAIGGLAFATLGRRRGTLAVLLAIALYVFLASSTPSAVRAGIMVGLALLARGVGRPADSLVLLVLAACAMVALQPIILTETSFQLSLSATLGIILLYPSFQRLLGRFPPIVAQPAGLTLAASLGALPVTLVLFNEVSLVSPVAHVLATPLLGPAFFASGLLALTLPLPVVPGAVAWLVRIPVDTILAVAHFSALVPASHLITGGLPPVAAAALAAGLLAWGLLGQPDLAPVREAIAERWAASRRAAKALVGVALAALTCVLVVPLARGDGLLHVVLLSSSGNTTTFLRGPDQTTVLLGGAGAEPTTLAQQVTQVLPVWEHGLGALVLLQGASASATASLVKKYPPSLTLPPEAGGELDLGDGAVLDVYPHNVGPADAALRYGNVWVGLNGAPPPPDDSDAVIALVGGTDASPEDARRPYLWVGASATPDQADYAVVLPRDGVVSIASDGTDIWPLETQENADAPSPPTS